MLKNRIIPCLDVKNGRVVKGINFVDNSFSKHEIKNLGSPSCSKCKKLYQRNELCPAIGYRHSV